MEKMIVEIKADIHGENEKIAKELNDKLTAKGIFAINVLGAPGAGKMAIGKIGVEDFDLVLLDLMLPDIDGFEVCRQLRLAPYTASVPIIMLSGNHRQSDRDRGLICGANSYFVKPFKSASIVDEINRLLAEHGNGP